MNLNIRELTDKDLDSISGGEGVIPTLTGVALGELGTVTTNAFDSLSSLPGLNTGGQQAGTLLNNTTTLIQGILAPFP